jgi:hypothetical protein
MIYTKQTLFLSLCITLIGCTNFPNRYIASVDSVNSCDKQVDCHRSLAVFFRWFYFYELENSNNNLQYQILAKDFSFTSNGIKRVNSRQEYIKNIPQKTVSGQNAHHVKSINFEQIDEGHFKLFAKVEYQNISKESVMSAKLLNYEVDLVDTGSFLPKLQKMVVVAEKELEPSFSPAFANNFSASIEHEKASKELKFYDTKLENDLRTFIHHWYAIFDERPLDQDLAEMLDEKLDVFLPMHITSRKQFLETYKVIQAAKMLNSHEVTHLDIMKTGDQITVDIYLVWQNKLDEQELKTKEMLNTMVLKEVNGKFKIQGYYPSALP